jgi:phosphonate transport system ATP-binding protein
MQSTRNAPSTGNGAEPRSLIVRDLNKEYVKGKPVLKGINFDVWGTTTVAIIGPSGTGKSTLLRCINRLIEPTSGTITLAGKDITKLGGQQLRMARSRVGMVFQEFNLVERLTVMENVLSGRLGFTPVWRAWLRKYHQEDIERAFELLDRSACPISPTSGPTACPGGSASAWASPAP